MIYQLTSSPPIAQYSWYDINGTDGAGSYAFAPWAINGAPDVYPVYSPSSLAWTPSTSAPSPFVQVKYRV